MLYIDSGKFVRTGAQLTGPRAWGRLGRGSRRLWVPRSSGVASVSWGLGRRSYSLLSFPRYTGLWVPTPPPS